MGEGGGGVGTWQAGGERGGGREWEKEGGSWWKTRHLEKKRES